MRIAPQTARTLNQITLVLACAALAISTTACTRATGSFDRTLSVNGSDTNSVTLHIATGSGNIHVLPGDPSQVHVIAHVTSWAPFQAQARVQQVDDNPPIEQSGSTINIGRNTPNGVSIDYDVTVPPGTQLSAHTGSGNLQVVNISGSTDASTGSGNIQADGLGGHVTLHTGSGDIHASVENSDDLRAQTGSGNIILKNVQGILVARTGSGDIDVTGTPSGGWDLHTGSGNVTLHTGSAHFSLDASTGSGSVHSDQSITTHGTLGHHHLTGDINGGGPTVHIATGSGDIRIR